MGTDECTRRSAGDARLGDGLDAGEGAQAAVRAGADDVEERAFAGEVRAVGRSTGAGRRGGRVGGTRDFSGEMGSGVVPGACVPAPAQEGGEECEDQGLQRGAQARGSAWGVAVGWALGRGEAICIHLGNISYVVRGMQGLCA